MKLPSILPRNKFNAGHYRDQSEQEKGPGEIETPVPFVTWRTLALGAFISIGGIIFGYDTGQISGFLEMHDFKKRYGQLQGDGSYKFNNVRSGLIVSLVCFYTPGLLRIATPKIFFFFDSEA